MQRGQDELLLLGRGQDLVEVDGDAEGDEEEPAYGRADPVRGLQRWWGSQLGPERGAPRVEEDGVVFRRGGQGWEV